ncbi:MAG: SGNH/GDSL hydrolase family protein [Byssovorax sp.]
MAVARKGVHLSGAACLLLLGADSLTLASLSQLLAALAAILVALVWSAAAALALAAPGGWIASHRWQIALLLGSITAATLLGLFLAAKIHMGPSAAFQREHFVPNSEVQAQRSDPEIGWAPSGPPSIVGQRLNTIDPARAHVIILGDSILYGQSVEEAETAPFLMGQALHDHQVLNLSVSGYSVEQYWLYLRRVLPHTHPKLVMIGVFTGNDFQLTGREFTPWGHSKPLYREEKGELVRVNSAEDCIDGLSQSLLFRPLWRDQARALALSQLLCTPRELETGDVERLIARLFAEIESLGRAAGARVVFVLLPNRYELNIYAPVETFYLSRYAVLKRLLLDGAHETVDTYPELLRHPRAELDGAFQSDSSHFTASGHRIVADYLVKVIDEKGYLR